MASILNPEGVMTSLRDGTVQSVKNYFPIEGNKHILRATDVYIADSKDIDDIQSQRKARMTGRTWASDVYGDFELVDKASGKVVDKKAKIKLLSLPQITRRFSYIVDGSEYQVDNQWRLKSGVYTRQRGDGGLETQFNLAKGRGFRMIFEPQPKTFMLRYGTSNIALLPVLQALGIPEQDIANAWGKEIYSRGVAAKRKGDLIKMAKSLDSITPVTTDAEAIDVIKRRLSETELYPETTKITLGKAYSKVGGDVLLSASSKLLRVNRGEANVDSRDALQFKELWSIEDFIPERIDNSNKLITRKIKNNLDRKDTVRGIISQDIFNVPVKAFFTTTSLAQQPTQVNPLDMIGGHTRTTLLGPGGISTSNAATFESKLIDPSHLGFLDPVATPEGDRTGITLHLGLGVSKAGREPIIKVYDTVKKEEVWKNPTELTDALVAFPDQFTWKNGVPSPKAKLVTVSSVKDGDPRLAKASEVDYILTSPKGIFSMTTNFIPFLASDQANRAEMATRHLEQAISLKNRENPYVQTHTGNMKSNDTWEGVVGKFMAHNAPVAGIVEEVGPDHISVKDAKGKSHKVPLYNNYPLNDKKSFIDSEPLVKKGDKVEKNQILADSSYTKNGMLSLGTNLRIAYLPYKGLVFEDGIVISESASDKLTSQHLYKERSYIDKNMVLGLKRFRAHYPTAMTDVNSKKLDEDGVIKKGSIVQPGDVIMAVMQKTEPTKEQLMLRGLYKIRPFKNKSVTWDSAVPGVVTDVVKNGREITAYVRTEEKADIGDKLSGRHGNKGVITAVIPDNEMPRDADGNPIEIIVNPSGVPGRINVGQVLETNLGKVAAKTKTSYAVNNFEPDDGNKLVKVKGHFRTIHTEEGIKEVWVEPYEYERGYHEMVQAELKEHDVSATTVLFDPETGKSLGPVLVGNQYVLKLMHQVDKKLSARSYGYGTDYDASLIPKGGGKSGAQKFGSLGMFALLAHGSTANIRDALTYKSDKTQDEVWTAIQTGNMLPAPKPSYAYKKFLAYLTALGVNVEKEGNNLILTPLTDKEILTLSNGELTEPSRVLRGKDLKPEKGGLFDEQITGGPGGDKWSHIKLHGAMPNPMYAKAIQALLGLKQKEYEDILDGVSGFSADGKVVEAEKAAIFGPAAIVDALKKIDVKRNLETAKTNLDKARKSDLDKWHKKVKYLQMLDRTGLSPDEAYVLENLPVLPPIFRPITVMEAGKLNVDGFNQLYRDVAMINSRLQEASGLLPDEELSKLKADLYDSLVGLMATGSTPREEELGPDGKPRKPGILVHLAGRTSPKYGYFHQRIIDRKQDLTMRSVIVPDLNLHLDEIGIPRKGAMEIFKPFVVQQLVRLGYTPLRAREEIDNKTPVANKALDVVVASRPVLFKRDPVLHKFGVMAFRAKLHDQSSIRIHPLVTGGFNADFDGDTMAVFVPVSQEAVEEAHRMMPSKNIFNHSTGKVMYQPTLEGQLGLFLLTQFGKKTDKSYSTQEAALKAAKAGDIAMSDRISVGGKDTTAGRIAFYKAIPEKAREDKYLFDEKQVMGSNNLQAVLRNIALKTPSEFQSAIDRVKDLGFSHAYNIGFSFKADDFKALRDVREKHLAVAQKKVDSIIPNISREKRDEEIIKIYTEATENMSAEAKKQLSEEGNALFSMYSAGVKPGWAQLQQLIIAPMLLQNAKNEIIPVPVTRSYSEGVDTAGYWVASSGARKGLIEKVQSVAKPGALSKQIMNTVISYVVAEDDCKTDRGIAIDLQDNDVIDRFTAKDIDMGGRNIPAGTLITADLATDMAGAKISKVLVRSPLKCKSPKGLCATCYGTFEDGRKPKVGTNIGAIAGQSIGERAVQISMKQFHTGGVAGSGGKLMSSMDRLTQILKMPQKVPGSSVLAPASGAVTSIKPDPAGGFDVMIGTHPEPVYVPAARELTIKKGDTVKKGQQLSDGLVNPRELLEYTNIDTVQRYLADELYNVFESEGVKRRNSEVVVKALTNLGVVENSGNVDGILRGDYISLSHAADLNSTATEPMNIKPVLRGIETLPLDQTTDWMARLQYRKLKDTLIQGSAEGWSSDIHGLHPTPGIAYSAEFGKNKNKTGPY